MIHLLSVWQDIEKQLRAASRVLLLCDYDGTLTPIVESPEAAYLPQDTKQVLQELANQRRFTVGVISGRALDDLKRRVGIKDLVYAGNHGLEIEGPDIYFINPIAEEMRPVFNLMTRVLTKAMATVRGVRVEDKGLTLSVHYRSVEEGKAEEVDNILERVIATARSLGKVIVTSGKKVYEVRPGVDWNKGKAIALLIDKYGKPKTKAVVLPVFLGDDTTDEDGFKVVRKQDGISIYVGEENTNSAADYYLKSPAEVGQLLRMIRGIALKDNL
ncbi:MAG: trehalose-phosphatase [Chloroflexi bacterium]|nr:trehalose-phosphatase [Chloroflexota bacterium]